MQEFLDWISNLFNNEVVIANASAVITFVTYIVTSTISAIRNKKTVKIKLDNTEVTSRLDKIDEKADKELTEQEKTNRLVILMIRNSKLNPTAKEKAEEIYEGAKIEPEVKPEPEIKSEETSKTVVEKLENELNA